MFKKNQDELELEFLIEEQGPELLKQFTGNFKTQTDTLNLIVKSKSYADNNH
ncbi:MAG: hypothetical protein JWQ14_560, partial [Adhaeribacter sp.]|nr:hypothetical protein [Adhaeribacter sp.]